MATGTVSASVDLDTKRVVAAYLRQTGTTANQVIRDLWRYIAHTGNIPSFDLEPKTTDEPNSFKRLLSLRSEVGEQATSITTMDTNTLRRELAERDV